MDATPGGGPGSSPPVAGVHIPVDDLADSKAPSVLCSSVGTQTESLSQLRSDSHRPLLASKRMVSRSAGTSIKHSNRTTQTSRSAATTAFQ